MDASAEWKPIEKPPDIKDEDGMFTENCSLVTTYLAILASKPL